MAVYTPPVLNPAGEELWTVEGPVVSFYSFPYPTRMAVARLASRQLWLWSPIALTSELAEELEKLGEVRYLVAPNKLHHLFLTEWAERYPGARMYAAPGLAKKREDLTFSAELDWDPRQLIVAHGPIIRQDAKEVIASSLAWIG